MSLIRFEGPNITANYGWEDGAMSPWYTYKNAAVVATFALDSPSPYEGSYAYKATITDGSTNISWIQFSHVTGLSVVKDRAYKWAFVAKAQGARNITTLLRQAGTPWATYGHNQVQAITTSWVLYSFDFFCTVNASDAKPMIYMGGDNNDVELDNLEFKQIVPFTLNPAYGSGRPYNFKQPRSLSDGGTFYSYNKGVREEFFDLKWKSLPFADWIQLDDFIRNTAVGSANVFTYTDQDGVAHSVRFESIEVDFREVRYQRYAGSIILRKVA